MFRGLKSWHSACFIDFATRVWAQKIEAGVLPMSFSKQESPDVKSPSYSRIVESVVSFVLNNFADEINLDDLAREAGMTRFNFCRRFHKECGVPPMRWLWNFRTILAAEFINLDPRWSLTDVAFSCGFSSSAHFSRSFKTMFEKSPSKYRKDLLELRGAGLPRVSAENNKAGEAAFDLLFTNNETVVRRAVDTALANS